jgi:hypothetical protein
MSVNFKQELLNEGRELKSRIRAYEKLPQTEETKDALTILKGRLDMISTYLKVKYNILAY